MWRRFAELMEGTDWDQYGVGKYEKCSNCMVHCGFEGTAATDSIRHPLKMFGDRPQGRPDRGPDGARYRSVAARPAEDVHSTHVERELERIKAADPDGFRRVQRAA